MKNKSVLLDSVRSMTESDLAQVLEWRNHPDIRGYMYTQRVITEEEHKRWFEGTLRDTQKHLLIFECDGLPKGFVQFSQENENHYTDWGFYTEPKAPRGTGQRLGCAALRYAFDILQVHKVCGEALAYNERSNLFHRTLGFQLEGRLRDHHFDGNRYHDVLRFGLLKSEWQTVNSEEL